MTLDELNSNSEIKQVFTPLDFLESVSELIVSISSNAKGFLGLPIEERIAVLNKRIHYFNVVESISKVNVKALLETQLKYEYQCLEKKTESGIFHLLTPDEILLKMNFNKMPIHGKMVDFGHKIGFILFNLKNSKGSHYFDFETIIAARWVCALFVQSNGEPFILKTMEEYLADGRKMTIEDFIMDLF